MLTCLSCGGDSKLETLPLGVNVRDNAKKLLLIVYINININI